MAAGLLANKSKNDHFSMQYPLQLPVSSDEYLEMISNDIKSECSVLIEKMLIKWKIFSIFFSQLHFGV